MPKVYGQSCPVAQSLEFLGERWTLLIVRDLLAGPKKFQDLCASLRGVAPAVLSSRLKVLEAHGIIGRRMYSDHPPRAEYALTDQGRELRAVVRSLGIWGSRHLHGKWTFVHEACDSEVEIGYFCPSCAKQVGSDQVQRRLKSPAPPRGVTPRPRRGSLDVAQVVRRPRRRNARTV